MLRGTEGGLDDKPWHWAGILSLAHRCNGGRSRRFVGCRVGSRCIGCSSHDGLDGLGGRCVGCSRDGRDGLGPNLGGRCVGCSRDGRDDRLRAGVAARVRIRWRIRAARASIGVPTGSSSSYGRVGEGGVVNRLDAPVGGGWSRRQRRHSVVAAGCLRTRGRGGVSPARPPEAGSY